MENMLEEIKEEKNLILEIVDAFPRMLMHYNSVYNFIEFNAAYSTKPFVNKTKKILIESKNLRNIYKYEKLCNRSGTRLEINSNYEKYPLCLLISETIDKNYGREQSISDYIPFADVENALIYLNKEFQILDILNSIHPQKGIYKKREQKYKFNYNSVLKHYEFILKEYEKQCFAYEEEIKNWDKELLSREKRISEALENYLVIVSQKGSDGDLINAQSRYQWAVSCFVNKSNELHYQNAELRSLTTSIQDADWKINYIKTKFLSDKDAKVQIK